MRTEADADQAARASLFAAAGTPTADGLKLLASWAVSHEKLPSERAIPRANGITVPSAGAIDWRRTVRRGDCVSQQST